MATPSSSHESKYLVLNLIVLVMTTRKKMDIIWIMARKYSALKKKSLKMTSKYAVILTTICSEMIKNT